MTIEQRIKDMKNHVNCAKKKKSIKLYALVLLKMNVISSEEYQAIDGL